MAFLQVSDDTLVQIFRTILDWHLSSTGFPGAIKALATSVINATLEVYSQSITKLLPTPTKSHYLFNLRDFARVIQASHSSNAHGQQRVLRCVTGNLVACNKAHAQWTQRRHSCQHP